MDSIMWCFHANGRYQRMAYLIITSFCLVYAIPLNGLCLAKNELSESEKIAREILTQADTPNSDTLVEKFDRLGGILRVSADPSNDGRKFLETFIHEINSKYALNLTIQDACNLVRERLPTLQLPEELQKRVLDTIELYESDRTQTTTINQEELKSSVIVSATSISAAIYWPWCGLGVKKRKPHKNKLQPLVNCVCSANPTNLAGKDLPSNCYIGGCELLAGALIFILPLPGAQWLGGLMLGDGVRRVIDGVQQLGDERRNDPYYVRPPNPPGINV